MTVKQKSKHVIMGNQSNVRNIKSYFYSKIKLCKYLQNFMRKIVNKNAIVFVHHYLQQLKKKFKAFLRCSRCWENDRMHLDYFT